MLNRIDHSHINEFKSLPPVIRLLTGLGIAQILSGMFAINIKQFNFDSIPVLFNTSGTMVTMPVPLVWILFGFTALAWSYIIIGILNTGRLVKFVLLTAFSLFMLVNNSGTYPYIHALAVVILTWLYILLRHLYLRPVGYIDFAAVFLLTSSIYTVNIISNFFNMQNLGNSETPINYLSVSFLKVTNQITYSYLVLIPVLLIAGLDILEFSVDLCKHAVSKAASYISARNFFLILIFVSVVILVGMAVSGGFKISIISNLIMISFLIFTVIKLYEKYEAPDTDMTLSFGFTLFIAFSALSMVLINAAASFLQKKAAGDMTNILFLGLTLSAILWAVIAVIRIWSKKTLSKTSFLLLVLALWVFFSFGVDTVMNLFNIDISLNINMKHMLTSVLIMLVLYCAYSLYKGSAENKDTAIRLTSFFLVCLSIDMIYTLFSNNVDIGAFYAIVQSFVFLILPTGMIIKNLAGKRKSLRTAFIILILAGLIFILSILNFSHLRQSIIDFIQLFIISVAIIWESMQFHKRFEYSKKDMERYYSSICLYFGYTVFLIVGLIFSNGTVGEQEGFFNSDLVSQFGIVIFGFPIALLAFFGNRKKTEQRQSDNR